MNNRLSNNKLRKISDYKYIHFFHEHNQPKEESKIIEKIAPEKVTILK